MSKHQLEEHIVRLREEIERERAERNYFQLERDKIHSFWEITCRQLEEKKCELRNKDREMEEAEEKHQEEMKVCKQKVKYLLYEHQNCISELKAEGSVSMKLAQNEHHIQESQLCKDIRGLRVEAKEQKVACEKLVKKLKMEHEKEITHLRKEFERQVEEIETKYKKKMQMLRDELELHKKTEIHEVEERKNVQIATLMENHVKDSSDIKHYYNDITFNNLALINSLKEQMEEMRKTENQSKKQKANLQLQNHNLTEPLQKAREEVAKIQRQLANYEKDKTYLANTKAHLKSTEKELNDLKLEHEVLVQRFQKTQSERDELYSRFTAAVQEVQQKTGFKNFLLERKLEGLGDTLEKKEAQLNEVLAASNLDPVSLNIVTRQLEDVLDSKNNAIKDLQYELAKVCKAHNDLFRTYEAKMKAF
ncbi:growth arrest-specific [Pristimantis euphronides]